MDDLLHRVMTRSGPGLGAPGQQALEGIRATTKGPTHGREKARWAADVVMHVLPKTALLEAGADALSGWVSSRHQGG